MMDEDLYIILKNNGFNEYSTDDDALIEFELNKREQI